MLQNLLADIRTCNHCAAHLPNVPNPVLAASAAARILIAGQAPGRHAHASGTPWDDISGERLRLWLGLTTAEFYDVAQVALVIQGDHKAAKLEEQVDGEIAVLRHARHDGRQPEREMVAEMEQHDPPGRNAADRGQRGQEGRAA